MIFSVVRLIIFFLLKVISHWRCVDNNPKRDYIYYHLGLKLLPKGIKMAGRTKLLIRANKCISSISRLYVNLGKLLHTDGEVNQVVYALYMEGAQTQKQISGGYWIPPQTVNNIVLALQKKGIVVLEENPADRRSKIIKFTDEGLEFAKKQIGAIVAFEKKTISRMGIENYKKMVELQELMFSSMRAELDERVTKGGK